MYSDESNLERNKTLWFLRHKLNSTQRLELYTELLGQELIDDYKRLYKKNPVGNYTERYIIDWIAQDPLKWLDLYCWLVAGKLI